MASTTRRGGIFSFLLLLSLSVVARISFVRKDGSSSAVRAGHAKNISETRSNHSAPVKAFNSSHDTNNASEASLKGKGGPPDSFNASSLGTSNNSGSSLNHQHSESLNASSRDASNPVESSSANQNEQLIGHLPNHPFQLSKFDTIFLYHSRKAGGSTLRRWLEKVTEKHNLTFAVREGYVVDDDIFNNHTLYITSVRDPIERIVSSYWFEGRYNKRIKNSTVDFDEWTKWVEVTHTSNHWVWQCLSECFCRWFAGGKPNFTKAVETLNKFDLVIQTERLLEEEYRDALQKLLDAEEFPIEHKNQGNRKPTAEDNSTYTLTMANMEYLVQRNKKDTALYNLVFGGS